ncbi:helix-turn-helix transcriptional regulator [archaeon]|jgi:plasmid maintenance system antidote protein VapI|nr:helix-turn-helix transcriptional regulator [archaeon]MBT4417482.1 helix-turn-helix transcriptional regulator [archaeon]
MKLDTVKQGVLKDYIEKSGRTRKDIANELELSTEHFSRLINGKYPFTENRAIQLYQALGEPEELAFLDTTIERDQKSEAWKKVYHTYEQELFTHFEQSPMGKKGSILEDLESLIDKYRKD